MVDTLILGAGEEGLLSGCPSKYSPELREQAVELVKVTAKFVTHFAHDLQIDDTTLAKWVKASDAERGVLGANGQLPFSWLLVCGM